VKGAEFSSDPASPPLSTGARLTIVLVHPASESPIVDEEPRVERAHGLP
jgi:hypothetical protein